jgi:thiol-disulfide isomerase/thioredoxin/tetratricopeptide (TPR) repeat protein
MRSKRLSCPEIRVLLLLPFLSVSWLAAPESVSVARALNVEQAWPAVADAPSDLESAIARVKSLYFARDFHHGTLVGEAALERWPESSELAAWTIANLSGSSGFSSAGAYEAVARAESLVKSQPVDVWSAIALAHAMSNVFERRIEALEASRRALELAPTLPEAVWIHGSILQKHQQYQAAAALIEEKWPVVDRQWPELLNIKGDNYLVRGFGVREILAEGLKILAEVRELDPENVNAHYLAGFALIHNQRIAEGAALLERAAELSPRSFGIASANWWAISRYPGLNAEEKLTLIRASAKELIAQQANYPGLVSSVAIELSNPWFAQQAELKALLKAEGIKYGDRVLKEYADTEHAEAVLMDRSRWLFEDLYFGVVEDTVAARAELSAIWWSFIDRPNHHDTRLLGEAYMSLFDHLRRDETVSGDTLLLLAHGAMENARYPYVRLANGLAERGVHLDTARLIAREDIEATEDYISNFYYASPGDKAKRLNWNLGNAYSSLGYVELKMGDLLAAREATDRALELNSKDSWVQFRAGALAEAEGNMQAAESHYALGEREERLWRGDKPNREALERIYTERHSAMDGLEEYIDGILVRDRDRRRQRVADTRIAEPRDLPAIDLEWLDGGRIGADELKGRIVVINFWGVWCGPCVAEAPQIQQLHEKYRDDPDVVFLTINAFDPDLDKVRTWMADNKYDWPVLVNDNFVTRYGVSSYPTTWFADRDGRILFEYGGASAAVFEEFVWRVEMLQEDMASANSTALSEQ